MNAKVNGLLKQLINLHPKYIDLSLKRLENLLEKIDNPHLKLPPVIHIAGTNGKGSTLSYLKHILIENDFKVHAYISPHLKKFNERIILDNKEIKTKKLYETLKLIKKINNNQQITFFEITTAAAFYLFSKNKADFLILETGLGGRLDATNIIKKSLIDIITPISLDHQEKQRNKIKKITNEKHGIIKKNSTVFISKQSSEVLSHIKLRLEREKNKKKYFNRDFKILNKSNKNFILRIEKQEIVYKNPNLAGDHQIENLSTAISAILYLKKIGYKISYKKVNEGITKTKWPARLEKGKLGKSTVYIDGAHNIDGATVLKKFFKKNNIKVWLIIGMLNNKNIYEFLKIIKPVLNGIVAIPIPKEKNFFTTEEIENYCDKLKIKCIKKKNISDANKFLSLKIKPKNILVSGSLYLVGRVRKKYL